MTHVDILNRRLGDALGHRGDKARFAWLWSPDQTRLVYDTDDLTILRKSWASAPAPDGGIIGPVWVLAEWRESKAVDHCGFGQGIRIAATGKPDYVPYYETALAPGKQPTDELTANYIWAISDQLSRSAEEKEDSFEQYMGNEKYTADQNAMRERDWNRERAAHIYDDNVGGFGNCEPGLKDGFLSWGGVGESPLVQKLQETAAA